MHSSKNISSKNKGTEDSKDESRLTEKRYLKGIFWHRGFLYPTFRWTKTPVDCSQEKLGNTIVAIRHESNAKLIQCVCRFLILVSP